FALFFGECSLVCKQGELEQLQRLRSRLFRGIAFAKIGFKITIESFSTAFTLQLTEQFTIGVLRMHVNTQAMFERSLQLISAHPISEYIAYFHYLPEMEQLLALPAMKEMHIVAHTEISADVFLQLIKIHSHVHFYRKTVAMVWSELKQSMKIISTETRDRNARLVLTATTITNWLKSEGLKESAKPGDIFGQFEFISSPTEDEDHLRIRFNQCRIRIDRFSWEGGDFGCLVSMTNTDEQ
ncbi:hypothetical protein PRIPAC_83558, partial [Pristionchus pacificus]